MLLHHLLPNRFANPHLQPNAEPDGVSNARADEHANHLGSNCGADDAPNVSTDAVANDDAVHVADALTDHVAVAVAVHLTNLIDTNPVPHNCSPNGIPECQSERHPERHPNRQPVY